MNSAVGVQERAGRIAPGDFFLFALLARDNRCLAQTMSEAITGDFAAERLDRFPFGWPRPAVVVSDSAPIHHGRAVRRRGAAWQARGLSVFYLPTYSPHLTPIKP